MPRTTTAEGVSGVDACVGVETGGVGAVICLTPGMLELELRLDTVLMDSRFFSGLPTDIHWMRFSTFVVQLYFLVEMSSI